MSRYICMRILFKSPKFYKKLRQECDRRELDLIKALGVLIRRGFVSKKKIILEGEKPPLEFTELGIAKDMLGFNEPKTKYTHLYSLKPSGEKYLAFLEYRDSLWEHYKTPWDDSLNKAYYDSITAIIKSHNYYGFTHTG